MWYYVFDSSILATLISLPAVFPSDPFYSSLPKINNVVSYRRFHGILVADSGDYYSLLIIINVIVFMYMYVYITFYFFLVLAFQTNSERASERFHEGEERRGGGGSKLLC